MRRHDWRRRAVLVAGVLCAATPLALTAGSAGAVGTSRATASHSLLSKSSCAANRSAGTMTFVSPFGYDASAGIIDVFAAQSLGYFSDMCLKVSFVTSSFTPNELVSAGTGTITGEGSAADDLLAVANGANLVAISTFGDTSDYALLTQSSITKLTQLEGKLVAYHTTMPVILTEMLQKAGVDVSKLQEVDDTSYNPDLLPEGKFAALQAYRSNEPITLREQHQGFREYIPSSFGVKGTFNVQVVNRTFLEKHPVAVADFLRAELHAFDYCTAHAAACVAFEKSAASSTGSYYDATHNLAEWRFEYALAEKHTLPGAGVGVQSQAEWAPEVAALKASGLVKAVPSLKTYEDTSLASSLYKGKKLIWPGK